MDADEDQGGDDDEDHLKKASEPLEAFSSSDACQQSFTRERWAACLMRRRIEFSWILRLYWSAFNELFYRMICEEVVDRNGTGVWRMSSIETQSKANQEYGESGPD